jgi:hypothetical protein
VIRAGTHLREVRAPAELGPPDLAPSSGIAGYARHNDAWYIHLSGGEARVRFGGKGNEAVPYIATANARLTHFRRNAEGAARRIEFGLAGHVPVKFTLAHAAGCELRVDGKVLKPSGSGAVMAYEVPRPAVNAAELSCPR